MLSITVLYTVRLVYQRYFLPQLGGHAEFIFMWLNFSHNQCIGYLFVFWYRILFGEENCCCLLLFWYQLYELDCSGRLQKI